MDRPGWHAIVVMWTLWMAAVRCVSAAELAAPPLSPLQPQRTFQLPPATVGGPAPVISALRLDSTGELLVAAGDDHVVRLILTQSGQLLRELRGHEDWVVSLAIAPDGRTVATAGSDRRVVLWDLASGRRLWSLDDFPGAVAGVKFSHGGQLLAVVGFSQPMRLVRVDNGQRVQQLDCPCRDMRDIAFSPDDVLIAGGGRNGRIRIWDLRASREVATFPGHRQRIRDLTFDDSGQHLITAGEDRVVRVWNVGSWDEAYVLSGVPGKVFSLAPLPNDRLAAAYSDNVIRVWDLRQRRVIRELRGHQGSVAALDANDRWLVSGGFDATVRIWPLAAMDAALAGPTAGREPRLTDSGSENATRPTALGEVD
jgi:WD40 repeat protein